MRRKALWIVAGLFLLVGTATVPNAQQAQRPQPSGQLKPDGVPFNFNTMTMEQSPAAGVAVKAGHMFDAKAGTMLSNQIILIKNGMITDVGPNVAIPAGAKV